MKQITRIFLQAVISVVLTAPATAADLVKNLLSPSPLTIALTVGQWLLKDGQKAFYVQVEATGRTAEQARTEAFKKAVDMAVGTFVIAETEVRNREVVRNHLLKYSAGFVSDFKVLSEQRSGEQIRMTVDVWVSESRIANRLMNVSKSEGEVDGARAAVQQESIRAKNEAATQLINRVVSDYPYRAFDVQMGKTVTQVDGEMTEILIPTKISWNKSFINALIEVLERTRENDDRGGQWNSLISYRFINGWINYFAAYRSDEPRKIIEDHLINSVPHLRALYYDGNGRTLVSLCHEIPTMNGMYYGEPAMWFEPGDTITRPKSQFVAKQTRFAHIGIYGDYESNFYYRVTLPRTTSWLAQLQRIELSVVRKMDCPVRQNGG